MSGLQDERLMQSLLNQGDFTFTRAVELANTLVLAKEQAKSLTQTQPQDSSQTGAESSAVHKVTQGQRRNRGKSSDGKARASKSKPQQGQANKSQRCFRCNQTGNAPASCWAKQFECHFCKTKGQGRMVLVLIMSQTVV